MNSKNDSDVLKEKFVGENIDYSLQNDFMPNDILSDQSKDPELNKEYQKQLLKQQRLEAKKRAEEISLEKRREKALKGINYLLGVSQKYASFFKEKVFSEETKAKPILDKNKFQPTLKDMKEAAKITRKNTNGKKYADVSKYLKYFEGGSLRPYQLDGVTWMTVLFENGLNGILADEMGLGKTIQVIALICHLLERKTPGPYLIVAPLSTLPNWKAEFERFAPQVPVVLFHGTADERRILARKMKKTYQIGDFTTKPVVITNYNYPLMERNYLGSFDWQYIIVDEGHRLKNHESKLSQVLRSFNSSNRLLLTGTPLQNNITELWSLMNFVLPHIFNNMDTFASLLLLEDVQDENKLLEEEEKNKVIFLIHKVLGPFMLRRTKKEVLNDIVPKKEVTVFCPLTKLQRDLYSYVISKNLAKLLRKEEENDYFLDTQKRKRKCVLKTQSYAQAVDLEDDSDFEDQLFLEAEAKETGQKLEKKDLPFITRLTMNNTMMMFKKIVDHPYLVHFPLDPNSVEKRLLIDEDLVNASGKLMVLDAMLPILKKQGHKVLIFSTLVMMLDMIEEFMILRGHSYRRLDGSLGLDQRGACISDFNKNSDVFAFLISTRAGGLGLNLTGADTVIFFDSDWNPQADNQAQDRCHRIGQTRPVMVYTLVTKNTIDEKIIVRGQQKRLLEKIVIKDGKFKMNQFDKVFGESELKDLQKLLEQENNNANNKYVFSKEELDQLLDRSELYEIMRKQKENAAAKLNATNGVK